MAAIIKIAVLNSTTLVPAATVQDWVHAVSIQVNRDLFRSAVKAGIVTLTYYAKGSVPPLDAWWVAVVDNADVANALGYHDLTPAGLPFGKVFVGTAITYNEAPSVTLSHEVLEMLGDAFVNVMIADGVDPNKFWAKEACDSVEAVAYNIDLPATTTKPARSYPVSDFVLPSYWNTVPQGRPYSFKDSLSGPVPTLTKGGYMAYTKAGVWSQVSDFMTPEKDVKARALEILHKRIDGPLDQRRIKRMLPKVQWVLSTAKKVG